jgi:putative flippase GtrA
MRNETFQHGEELGDDAPAVLTPPAGTWNGRRETRKQLARFLVVGGASVAVDLIVYAALLRWSLDADLAKGASYLAGVVVGFFGNKWWTFESARRSVSEPVSYLALYSITLVVNVACNRGVLSLLGQSANVWAFLFATGVTTMLNFIGMKFVTFRRGVEQRREESASRAV